MTRTHRMMGALAAIMLLAVFALPLWRIGLIAPQYPEGLGMQIRINTVEGARPADLQNINELNHYIGMHVIEPQSIPELRWMPWIVVGLVAAGLGAALSGRRALVIAWLVALTAIGAAGMADFYSWEYDYGHDLDIDRAIIKVPGMSYQPPLIGSKQLLNFTATSWPAEGAWVIAVAFGLGVAATIGPRRRFTSTGEHTQPTLDLAGTVL